MVRRQWGRMCLEKGGAGAPDHNWLLAAKWGLTLWVERAASDDNLSDEPSRMLYTTVEQLDSKFVKAWLLQQFARPQLWTEVLSGS